MLFISVGSLLECSYRCAKNPDLNLGLKIQAHLLVQEDGAYHHIGGQIENPPPHFEILRPMEKTPVEPYICVAFDSWRVFFWYVYQLRSQLLKKKDMLEYFLNTRIAQCVELVGPSCLFSIYILILILSNYKWPH